jgi:hypothetical protein
MGQRSPTGRTRQPRRRLGVPSWLLPSLSLAPYSAGVPSSWMDHFWAWNCPSSFVEKRSNWFHLRNLPMTDVRRRDRDVVRVWNEVIKHRRSRRLYSFGNLPNCWLVRRGDSSLSGRCPTSPRFCRWSLRRYRARGYPSGRHVGNRPGGPVYRNWDCLCHQNSSQSLILTKIGNSVGNTR